ncbi:pyridoxamine 5'-phosphate oxidase family protein [Rhodanobacter aciditrophus]|uniref:Pyridoxamine 5'-phosphate oxidase family protein n=1 Tax=Rhodanobacter aciditrophus TaxID=1623218 RepID=A0ABW4B0W0_9GAMM
MSASLQTPTSTVKRGANRASYDVELVHKILDDTLLCHIGQQMNGQVFVTPTCHWREGDYLYWHAHSKARNTHGAVKEGQKVCINVCELDGLVLARSAFHHSVNYRSVTLFGVPEPIEDYDEKMRHFKLFVDKVSPNRWDSLRPVKDIEVKATGLVRIKIEEASVKVRAQGALDDDEDFDWPVWAGVLPLEKQWQAPQQNDDQTQDYPAPTAPHAK